MSKTDPMLIVERRTESADLVAPGQGSERRPRERYRAEPTDGGAGLSTDSLRWRRAQRGSTGEEPKTLWDSPVLVEAPAALLTDVLGPDGLEGAEAPGGLDVADHADGHHGRRLDDGDRLDDLLLVDLGAGAVGLAHDVGHAGLVADEGREVARLRGVVLGEGLDLAAVALGALLGVEAHGPMAGSGKLAVRLQGRKYNVASGYARAVTNPSTKICYRVRYRDQLHSCY